MSKSVNTHRALTARLLIAAVAIAVVTGVMLDGPRVAKGAVGTGDIIHVTKSTMSQAAWDSYVATNGGAWGFGFMGARELGPDWEGMCASCGNGYNPGIYGESITGRDTLTIQDIWKPGESTSPKFSVKRAGPDDRRTLAIAYHYLHEVDRLPQALSLTGIYRSIDARTTDAGKRGLMWHYVTSFVLGTQGSQYTNEPMYDRVLAWIDRAVDYYDEHEPNGNANSVTEFIVAWDESSQVMLFAHVREVGYLRVEKKFDI